MNLQENISIKLRRRAHSLDKVINNLLPNMYPCDYNSSDHFVEGVIDEIRWFLLDVEELKGIERMDIENYILDYKYDELTEYFNERCVVLKNDNLQESIRRILREETEPEYAVIEITKPLARMEEKYYYQIVPYWKTKEDKIYINKGASGRKTISTDNIKVLKTFKGEDNPEMKEYLNKLRG